MESESQPNWVRAELELRSIDRVISLDALLNTDAVFAAAYPAFAFITAERLEIRTTSRQRQNNGALIAERLERYCVQSYGKYLNFLRHVKELSDIEIINRLTKGLNPWDIPDSINKACITPPNQMELTT